jgi:hypothetical protein
MAPDSYSARPDAAIAFASGARCDARDSEKRGPRDPTQLE